MSVDLQGAGKRVRAMSQHALKRAGLGAAPFPAGPGAVHVSLRLPAPRTGLRCYAADEAGVRVAQAPLHGEGTRQLARLTIPDGPARTLSIHIEDESGAAPEIVDIRVQPRPHGDPHALWRWPLINARWQGDTLEVLRTGDLLAGPGVDAKDRISGEISFEAIAERPMVLGLLLRNVNTHAVAAARYWMASGPTRGIVAFRNVEPGLYSPVLVAANLFGAERPLLRALDLEVRADLKAAVWQEEHDTYLPHWGKLKRFIHRLCKRDSGFNGFVQGIEFRLQREELLSVPRFMSFCPTGQCNALCDFCSVTINRTGIIKKQIEGSLIERFTKPVRRSVQMYGLEGNGEPTLHRGFPELVSQLTASESDAYLITNGTRFSESLLPALMRLESVNVSLNAATPETHRAVMKLKEHEIVIEGLKRIVAARGFKDPALSEHSNPRVSVSFVATRHNVHEIERFLTMAEDEIGVDLALIRPLSELGNETGSVEDLREIVPYDSDVQDLVDAVEDYIAFARRRLEISFNKEAFRSVRPDPIGYMARPPGYEGRLLAPRPRYWSATGDDIALNWRVAKASLKGRVTTPGVAWETVSAPIPVLQGEALQFRALADVRAGAVKLSIEGEAPGDVLWERTLACGDDGALLANINTGARKGVKLRLQVSAEIDADFDFERLRTPSAPVETGEAAMRYSRWEVGASDVEAHITADSARVRFKGPSGPYVIKSYAVPVPRGARLRIKLNAKVTAGTLGVGLLSADQARWMGTAVFENGEAVLEAATGQDDAVRMVFYPRYDDGLLEAHIDFTSIRMETEEVAETDTAPLALEPSSPPKQYAPAVEAAPAPIDLSPPRLIALEDAGGRKRKYFCHKPWSDLHNFTVDGRMDVCCIATGPSQERYALGNLNTQNFQDVWNGATAKLFRRTVNSDKVLPPCARCPMGYQYHGMWFHREHTIGRVNGWLWSLGVFKPSYMKWLGRRVIDWARPTVSWLFFRNFK